MKYAFVVVSLGYWGRGKTLKEAAENCRKEGAKRTDDCYAQIVIGDDKPEITDGGCLTRDAGSEVIMVGALFKLGALLKLKH